MQYTGLHIIICYVHLNVYDLLRSKKNDCNESLSLLNE
jgi:hypothetical protein